MRNTRKSGTGLSTQFADTGGKKVALLREAVPGLRRLAVLGNVGYHATMIEMSEVQAAASTLGQQIYCSTRCRKRAAYARAIAEGKFNWPASSPRYVATRDGTNPRKNTSDIKVLRHEKSRPTVSFSTPVNIIGGGQWSWPGSLPPDPILREKILRAEIGDRMIEAVLDQPGGALVGRHSHVEPK